MTQIDFTKLPGRLRNIPDLVREAMKKWVNGRGNPYKKCPFCIEALAVLNIPDAPLMKQHCKICICDPGICDNLSDNGLISEYDSVCSDDYGNTHIDSLPNTWREILARFDRMLLEDG